MPKQLKQRNIKQNASKCKNQPHNSILKFSTGRSFWMCFIVVIIAIIINMYYYQQNNKQEVLLANMQTRIRELEKDLKKNKKHKVLYKKIKEKNLELETNLETVKKKLYRYEEVEPRSVNPEWLDEHLDETNLILDNNSNPLTGPYEGVENLTTQWKNHLNINTPRAWHNEKDTIDCYDIRQTVIPEKDLKLTADGKFRSEVRDRATNLLRECGFVYLDNLFDPKFLKEIRAAYEEFKKGDDVDLFRYPCQGVGRIEHMLPFRPPFNNTKLYGHPVIRKIILHFLKMRFNLELMTVIHSPPGSKNQRWHQGWRMLWHEAERTPPYAIVVTVPLDNVDGDMGPTEFCPRRKVRFYHGWRCDKAVMAGSTLGTVIMFDYKLLHRGPSNLSNKNRPVISMVFTSEFFVNTHAMTNRGISMVQTLHQRRYWEHFTFHPPPTDIDEYWKV